MRRGASLRLLVRIVGFDLRFADKIYSGPALDLLLPGRYYHRCCCGINWTWSSDRHRPETSSCSTCLGVGPPPHEARGSRPRPQDGHG
jgi:hypothetical protein